MSREEADVAIIHYKLGSSLSRSRHSGRRAILREDAELHQVRRGVEGLVGPADLVHGTFGRARFVSQPADAIVITSSSSAASVSSSRLSSSYSVFVEKS